MESVYNLIPRQEIEPTVPKKHVSKFRSTVKDEEHFNKTGDWKTMGPPKIALKPTNDFTRKHESDSLRRDLERNVKKLKSDDHCEITFGGKPAYCSGVEAKKPPVPRREEQPVMGLRTNKNFVQMNAIENIMGVPRKAEKKFVDTTKGDTQNLIPSGLEPVFTKKKEFGKMPDYLQKRNEEVARAAEEYDSFVKEYMKRGQMEQLSRAERQAIIDGLKANWEKIHKEYQNLSVMIDTVPKKMRKLRMEQEMAMLEKDIDMLERHLVIYISN